MAMSEYRYPEGLDLPHQPSQNGWCWAGIATAASSTYRRATTRPRRSRTATSASTTKKFAQRVIGKLGYVEDLQPYVIANKATTVVVR
jgi:hypothetical protein